MSPSLLGRATRWVAGRVDTARRGAQLFVSSGLSRTLHPLVLSHMAQALVVGQRGALALIHLHALTTPNAPAVVAGGLRLSYRELEQRVNRLTHGLAALGLRPGARIGALLLNGPEFLELNAALPAVGGVAVQLGTRLKPPEVAYLVENSGAEAIVFSSTLVATVEGALSLLGPRGQALRSRCFAAGARVSGFPSYDELLVAGAGAQEAPAIQRGAGSSGMMIYTSGTTGRAKGATRDFGKMGIEPAVHLMSALPLRSDERHLVVCPLYHSAAPAFAAMTMGIGGCVVLQQHFDPEELLRTVEQERITSTLVVPTMLQRLLALPDETLHRYDLSSLRWIMTGAAPLATETARRVEETFGPILYNFYGATETGLVSIALPGEHTARPGTVGRLIGGNEVRLLDEAGRDVPEGQVGEIFVQSPMAMEGYHDNPDATRAAQREGFLSVGDLGWLDRDGYLYLAERKSDLVITGGVNVYPWEIEQRLHEHPAVADVAVVGAPSAEWGEELVAFVVRRPGREVTAEALIDWVRAALADFKRPRDVLFVDELPRNPTGKLQKRELRARAADRGNW